MVAVSTLAVQPGSPVKVKTPMLESGATGAAQKRAGLRQRLPLLLLVLASAALGYIWRGHENVQRWQALFSGGVAEKTLEGLGDARLRIVSASGGDLGFGSGLDAPQGAAQARVAAISSNKGLPIFTNPRGPTDALSVSASAGFVPQPAGRLARRHLMRQEPNALSTNPTCQPDLVVAEAFSSPILVNDLNLPWDFSEMAAAPQVANGRIEFGPQGGKSWLLTRLPCSPGDSPSADAGFFMTYQKYTGISYTLTGPPLVLPYGVAVKVCATSPVLAGESFYVEMTHRAESEPAMLSFHTLFANRETNGVVPQIEFIAWETLPAATYALDDVRLRGTCATGANTGRLFDPGYGKFIYGASIDGDDSPQSYIERLEGKVRPMLWNTYVVFSNHFPTEGLYKVADTLLALPYPTILAIFAMPQSDGAIDAVTPEGIRQLAAACKTLNDRGLRILLNLGHEGNGYWYKYGGQPKKYRELWKKVSTEVRRVAGERTALVWHMNSVIPNYWANGMQWDPELDTNGNGVIDREDDPFTPYFPGPEYVDWVGLSFYHYGIEYPWKENYLPESPTKFRDGLDGRMGTNPHRFYTMFAERYNLPMAVMETGCAYFVESDPGPGRLAMAQAWWRQVYSRELFKELPLLRLIEYFEHLHPDEGTTRDYRITTVDDIRREFLKDLPLDMISAPGDGVWR